MSKKRARLVVVGLGSAGSRHAQTVANYLPNAELASIVEPGDPKGADWSQRLAVPRTTYAEALANDAIDGVVLATPTPLHPEMINEAAAAGKHVFCEKPLGLDLPSSVSAVQAAEQAGIILQVGFVRRFDPDWADARHRVKAGEIGEVYFLRAGQREKITYTDDPSYIEEVGNFFQDVMIHEIDVARWIVGEIVEVHAWGTNPGNANLNQLGDAQVASVQLRFASGAIGSLDGTMLSAHGYDCYTEVLGRSGAIRIGYGCRTADVVMLAGGGASFGRPTDFRVRFEAGFVAELRAFADAILFERPSPVDGWEGLASYAVAEAATESYLSGAPAKVPAVAMPAQSA
jgi:predicted dehydrogenase